jgi:putative ABC transport system permease protein
MLKNYFTVALRNLWRNKTFSIINITGLSVGLACCMLIFLYAKDEVSYDRFHRERDNIYRITYTMTELNGQVHKNGNTGMVQGPNFKLLIPEVEDFIRIQSDGYAVKLGTQIFDQDAHCVDDNFFTFFSFPLVKGDPKTVLKDIHSIVLTEDVAKKYFGNEDAMGKVLELKTGDNFEPFTVTGIAKKSPQNSSIKFAMLLPMKFRESKSKDDQWLNSYLNTFIRIRPGTHVATLEAKFDKVFHNLADNQIKDAAEKYGFKDKIKYSVQPLLAMHLSTDYPAQNGLSDESNPVYSYILSGIAILILLIACINFVNLTVARSLKRAKEIGIRKVIGSYRRQLILQFLGESLILSFLAFVLAVILANVLLPFFNEVSNKSLSFSYLLDAKLVLGYIGLFLLTGLLAGFYPAIVLSKFNPVQTLYGKTRLQGKNYLSKSLVVFQFALATFLIIATFIIHSQFNYLTHFDLGYNDKGVARLGTGGMDREKYNFFRNELLNSPHIQSVTTDQGGRWGTLAHINGDKEAKFDIRVIDENYLPLFEIPIVKGRNFQANNLSDTADGVLVNENFVTYAGWKNPIGETIDFFYDNKKYHVIGVYRDYHFSSLTEKIGPQIFLSNPRYRFNDVFVKIKPGHSAEALHFIDAKFKENFPFQPYQYNFKDAENRQQYESESKWKQIIDFGAMLTIFISCIGLFGLATLSAEKRTKEIGIRKVLGASVTVIVRKLSGDFLKLVVISAIIAIPAAWWAMNTWLDNYPYRVTLSGWVFALAGILVLVVALITMSFQVIKAAIANPVKSLKEM